jgi:hypothetical protein
LIPGGFLFDGNSCTGQYTARAVLHDSFNSAARFLCGRRQRGSKKKQAGGHEDFEPPCTHLIPSMGP